MLKTNARPFLLEAGRGLRSADAAWKRSFLIVVVMLFVLQMMHRAAISLTEGIPIVADELAFDLRMFIPVMIVCVAVTVIAEIVARSLDSIVKALALGITIFRRRLIPSALPFILGL
jgi:hypothetical protein